jgi:hypothetical protein
VDVAVWLVHTRTQAAATVIEECDAAQFRVGGLRQYRLGSVPDERSYVNWLRLRPECRRGGDATVGPKWQGTC